MQNIKNIYINSAFRSSGTPESFTIVKTSNFNRAPKRAKLLSARIPFTWNNLTAANNLFTLIETGPAAQYPNIPVPPGWYDGTTLGTALQTALNALGGHVYTVVYDTSTYLFTISATGNFQFDFDIPDSIGPMLGFGTIITVSGASITSPGVANLLVDYEICITSDIVGGIDNAIVRWQPGAPINSRILAMIPVCSCRGSVLKYQASSSEPWQDVTQSSFFLDSALRREISVTFGLNFISGNTVDLNGANWDANILLEF